MLKYLIFILIFNILSSAQDFDIYEISNHKIVFKRKVNFTETKYIQTDPHVPPKPQKTPLEKKHENTDSVRKNLKNDEAAINDTNNTEGPVQQKETVIVSAVEESKNKSSTISTPTTQNPKHTKHPGAGWRGFYVFVGLSILIIIYFIFKAFRLRPGAAPPATVRKYGIVGRRSDMEMLPLPLAEDEDDDTLFEMGTQINR